MCGWLFGHTRILQPCSGISLRIAFIRRDGPTLARRVALHSRHVTGIEIHPGATIGRGFIYRPWHGCRYR